MWDRTIRQVKTPRAIFGYSYNVNQTIRSSINRCRSQPMYVLLLFPGMDAAGKQYMPSSFPSFDSCQYRPARHSCWMEGGFSSGGPVRCTTSRSFEKRISDVSTKSSKKQGNFQDRLARKKRSRRRLRSVEGMRAPKQPKRLVQPSAGPRPCTSQRLAAIGGRVAQQFGINRTALPT